MIEKSNNWLFLTAGLPEVLLGLNLSLLAVILSLLTEVFSVVSLDGDDVLLQTLSLTGEGDVSSGSLVAVALGSGIYTLFVVVVNMSVVRFVPYNGINLYTEENA